MRLRLCVMTVLLLCFASAFSQAPYKVFTSPKLPARDALERMNLRTAWHARVGVDGQRDGIQSVQLIPGKSNQLVVQTFKGAVFLFDADNGDLIWKTTSVGIPYWEGKPAGWNSQCIFVSRRNVLHVLDRATGAQRVFSYEPGKRDPTFGFELLLAPSSGPVADEEFLYISMARRLHAIYIPDFEGIERTKRIAAAFAKKDKKDAPMIEEKKDAPGAELIKESGDSPQPFVYWAFKLDQAIDSPGLFSEEQISVLTNTGFFYSVNRYGEGPRKENFEFEVKGNTPGGAGQHDEMAYFGASDFNVYAVRMRGTGGMMWRHVAGAPVLHKPDVNDRDVFIAPERLGLRKLDRKSGREVWTNRDAQRFLAANHSFVYAVDHVGTFFVLDAKRGTTLAKHDLSQWTITVANEYTDRIYLAAHDGQILCLRHRDLAKPLVMKTVAEFKNFDPNRKDEPKKKEEKKDEEKKDEEKKLLRHFERDPILVHPHVMHPRVEASRHPWLDDRAWALR